MPQENLSRRRFLSGVTAGSTGAALGILAEERTTSGAEPGFSHTSSSGAPPAAPDPVVMESYPIVEPDKNAAPDQLKVVTTWSMPEALQQKIRSSASGVELKICSPEEFARQLSDAHVIFGDFSRQDLTAARQLRWVQYTAAGVEHILYPELVESPVVLTNMQRIYAPVISESAIGLMLALARGIPQYSQQTRERTWKEVEGLVEISGMTLGLVGMGGIGTQTAYRAHYGFGMQVVGVDPKPLPKPAFVAELHSLDWLPTMASQVDILMSAAPHTPLSQGMLNETIFRAMKRSAYFINVSRGKVVDTPALIRALKEGWIAGAGLDVAYKEPLPPDDPLWSAPNIVITCHTSAHSPKVADRMVTLFAENLRRYREGLPLLNVVDKKRGY
jgi:phosphoglycerate dehydrogenase-like enzyme